VNRWIDWIVVPLLAFIASSVFHIFLLVMDVHKDTQRIVKQQEWEYMNLTKGCK